MKPSSIGSSGRPIDRIWKKWSMTQIEPKPTWSASWAMRPSVGPMAASPPGHEKELIWSPSFMGGECSRAAAQQVTGVRVYFSLPDPACPAIVPAPVPIIVPAMPGPWGSVTWYVPS